MDDRRSRILHEAVAAKVEANPALLNLARANLARWMESQPADVLREWRTLLDETPFSQLLEFVRSDDERAVRLRQSSPFAGVLTPEERQSILDRHDARRA